MPCPLKKIPNMHCDWNEYVSNLSKHVFQAHRDIAYEGPQLVTDISKEETLFIVFESEVFILCKYIENSELHAAVQMTGVRFDDFKCTFLFECEDSPEYSKTTTLGVFRLEKFRPHEDSNKWNGLTLSEVIARQYLGKNKFTVVLELDIVK